MRQLGLFERLVFGREGVRRAEEAERRVRAACAAHDLIVHDYEASRARLREVVAAAQRGAEKLSSEPPPRTQLGQASAEEDHHDVDE